jgi:hypothetical protein
VRKRREWARRRADFHHPPLSSTWGVAAPTTLTTCDLRRRCQVSDRRFVMR